MISFCDKTHIVCVVWIAGGYEFYISHINIVALFSVILNNVSCLIWVLSTIIVNMNEEFLNATSQLKAKIFYMRTISFHDFYIIGFLFRVSSL